MTYKTKGLILKRANLGETDKILTIYTDDFGKISVIAKGIRRTKSKLAGHLDLFNYVSLMLASGKNLDVVCSSENIKNYPFLKSNLLNLGMAYYVAELVDKLIKEKEKSHNILNLQLEIFDFLNKDLKSLLPVRYFEFSLIKILGYEPELSVCVYCKKTLNKNKLYFSAILGGLICENCYSFDPSSKKVQEQSVKILRLFKEKTINDLTKIKNIDKYNDDIGSLLRYFLNFNFGEELKSVSFLEDLKKKQLVDL